VSVTVQRILTGRAPRRAVALGLVRPAQYWQAVIAVPLGQPWQESNPVRHVPRPQVLDQRGVAGQKAQ